MNKPKHFHHPTFGECEIVSSIYAIKLKAPMSLNEANNFVSGLSLKMAVEPALEKGKDSKIENDPAASQVNLSTTLLWVTMDSKSNLDKIAQNDAVEWVSPIYKAKSAENIPQTYFAVNPKTLLLKNTVASLISKFEILEIEAAIDQSRSNLLKGYTVLNLTNPDSIEAVSRLSELPELKNMPNAIKLENIPYILPTTGCGCGGNDSKRVGNGKCAPSVHPHIPNDTFFPNQWGLHRINNPSAWSVTKGDPNIVIAVLDQGVQLDHPDLNMYPVSYSTITHTNDGSPVGNHGTPCAGIIGAKMDNSLGIAGVANGCKIMAIATNFADTEVAEGLYYAADNGARAVSMSFGVYPFWMVWDFSIIEAALQYCLDKNVVLVAASGNEDIATSRFPGSDPRTICVGGSNRNDVRKAIGDTSIEPWWGACFGAELDVVAPCLEIPSTDRLGALGYTPTDYIMWFNGTSSATPHVAGIAGLILSVNPGLSSHQVRQIISETTDKISPDVYFFVPTAGKPFGTWNHEVGYGRVNAERAVLRACAFKSKQADKGLCDPDICEPEDCCVSPCDPPWKNDEQCMFWYEDKIFRVPILDRQEPVAVFLPNQTNYLEFKITYRHKLCLLGKQHGPLLFTLTLLPGESLRLYHSDRYRRITSTQQRYSVQTTFMQFLSIVHQARIENSLDALNKVLSSSSSKSSEASGGGFFFGLGGFGGGSSNTSTSNVASSSQLSVHSASELFNQSVVQSSQLTYAERSIVISTYEEQETKDISVRTLQNLNECRAVTYFIRQIVELYAQSTQVADITYRVIAPNIFPEWRTINDINWLPESTQNLIKSALNMLPKIGEMITMPRPISIPSDGVIYDPELANCCSCEPERAAAIEIRLKKENAEAIKSCLEIQELELEIQRRKMLLQKGDLTPFLSGSHGTENFFPNA